MKIYLIAALCSLALTVFAGAIFIPVLKRVKAGQPILKYVKTHENKSGTPTMGGLFFLLSAAATFIAFDGTSARIATVSLAITLFYMLVGFLDDFIKIKSKHNEGLKPYQKIIFQTAIAVLGGAFAYVNGLSVLFIPFERKTVDIGVWAIPVVALVFIATTNSVNLTDGLDGLAGGTTLSYLTVFIAIIAAERATFSFTYLKAAEYDGINLMAATLIGGVAGFLVFNVNKARVFMGDTGSLGLGGAIGALSVFSGNALFLPIMGAAFVWSSLSVIIQVVKYRRTGRRAFLMAPFHHHLQMKGLTETQIGFIYSLITVITGVVCVIFYL